MQGAGLKAECSGGPCAAPSPGAARVAGRSDTPGPGAPARVLRADPASPPHREPALPHTPAEESGAFHTGSTAEHIKMNSPAVSSRFSAFKL